MNIQIGHRVGELTVVEATDQRKGGYVVWRCRCDCGGEILLDTRCLQRETVRDCGCKVKTTPKQKNLSGKRFGRLTAIEPTSEKGRNGALVWRCRCDCGNGTLALSTQLAQGYKKSCGCLSHPALKDYVGKRFSHLVVTEYAGKRDGMHRWKCQCDCGREVVVGQTNLQSGKTRSCGCLQAEMIKDTLELCEGTSVLFLKKKRGRVNARNKSGCTGVYKNSNGRWAAQIAFRGKTYYLGSYAELSEAVRARRCGEEMYDEFLKWYYLEHLGMDELPDDVRKLIES